MPSPKRPDPRIPLIAEIMGATPPSTVRIALARAGVGDGTHVPATWSWSAPGLRRKTLAELEQIQRIIARSTHIETEDTA